MKTKACFLIIFHTVLLGTRNVYDESCKKNQNTHFTFSNCFWKLRHLWGNVEKYIRAGQATDDSITYVHCMLCTWGSQTHSEYVICVCLYVVCGYRLEHLKCILTRVLKCIVLRKGVWSEYASKLCKKCENPKGQLYK
jgi:hypothetical protein